MFWFCKNKIWYSTYLGLNIQMNILFSSEFFSVFTKWLWSTRLWSARRRGRSRFRCGPWSSATSATSSWSSTAPATVSSTACSAPSSGFRPSSTQGKTSTSLFYLIGQAYLGMLCWFLAKSHIFLAHYVNGHKLPK